MIHLLHTQAWTIFDPFNLGLSTVDPSWRVVTCMNNRAVHIEISDSMNTNSCVNAIRRFLARIGHIKEMTSDNGSNLVGANRELLEAIRELDEEVIQRFVTNHGIK